MKLTAKLCALLLLLAASPWCADGQDLPPLRASAEGWAPFGNTSILAGVSGAATGPVSRVWFRAGSPMVQLPGGEVYAFSERSSWVQVSDGTVPEKPRSRATASRRADMKLVLGHPLAPTLAYAVGDQVYRSEDNGTRWTGLTRYRGISLLGEDLVDLALNPLDPEDLLVASELGVWRSRDGGLSWFNAGEDLPNFSVRRILAFPEGTRGLQVETYDGKVLEWVPGSVYGWKRMDPVSPEVRRPVPAAVQAFGDRATAWESVRGQIYVAVVGGSLLASQDNGATWREYSQPDVTVVRSFQVNPDDERMAIAIAESDSGQTILLRTLNGGTFWDEWTPQDLLNGRWSAAAASWEQGALYIAADREVLRYSVDFRSMGRPTSGIGYRLEGLPAQAVDLRIDPSGTTLFVVARNTGIFTAEAPGIRSEPLVRHAADLSRGAVAPGSLLSIYGNPIERLRANGEVAALLGGRPGSTQVQLPYALSSDRVELRFESAGNQSRTVALPLRRAMPAIFLHPDGNPFILHPGNGLFMDENNPLTPGTGFQVLMTGLGAVTPDWPVGMAAPLENPPAVLARVEALVNGLRVPVTRATLAPGYAGIYLVEIELPGVLDEGVAELRIVADGNPSNPVALHVAY